MTVMERIEELNRERGWSLYELSKRTKIAEATVYTWKRQNKTPSIPVLEKICKSYGITTYQFFAGMHSPELTDEQNALLAKWSLLSEEEKAAINTLFDLFTNKR